MIDQTYFHNQPWLSATCLKDVSKILFFGVSVVILWFSGEPSVFTMTSKGNILNDFQAQSASRYLFNSSPRDICKQKEALQKETMT